ncbi:hypothetical protein HN51_002046 [Arachis hypogaea]|uniref:Ribosomal protein S16 n=1 Tax=Arachis hypogaea TaxID=3818 RepID=A0A445ENY6_ARAHY|nr:30S ribosomal protein S16-1, chloroplastic [Arachis hypogaea]QHO50191.1 Ribosomal protein [Arachis hypogaea]RYR77185.1 hypothetical protein Ahy_A01g001647 [Arachis hypogaea]
MTVRIRFARFGCTHRPFYRIVAADSKSTRDGGSLEILGFYDPLAGNDSDRKMALKFERVKYWLSVGAQPSEAVEHLLLRAGLLPPPPIVAAGGPRGTSSVGTSNQEQPADANRDDGVSPEAIFSIGLQVN